MVLHIVAQDIKTGVNQRVEDGAKLKAVPTCMLFFGVHHVGIRARLSGPKVNTAKETITQVDLCIPDTPFEMVPGKYTLDVFIDADDTEDQVLQFEVI